ncbi:Dehydrogenase/reductase SDR family member on chromosome X [Orchesella cincta]|uniref:Dehydrogenase/reductase SDR family member on chromosome X n=1 Tax=Orchesella cincta TaxID=48709 RepID=A0A1D2MUI4_ORCCI|nr:Dehydrogenase/reductase SDR family member on chromosome X [Orchesella cincta]
MGKIPNKTGQVAVISGSPRSLTFGIAKRLLQLDYTVIIGIKRVEECNKKIAKLKALGISTKNLKLIEVDYKSLKSVSKFAESVLERCIRIDLLICNGGVINAPYEVSDNGLECHFQINYLSQFLLTNLLLERMKYTSKAKDSPCQIIYVTSVAHFCSRLDFLELEKSKVYNAMKCFYDSKLCQVASMLTLDRVLKTEGANVQCFAIHPGMINVDLWESIGIGSILGSAICRPIETAADTILWPVFCPEFESKGGLYMENGKAVTPSWEATNSYTQQRLWGRSYELIRKYI